MASFWKGISAALLAAGLLAGALLAGAASVAAKDQITIDLVNEPATLDPHMQWNPDSYYVYRNIFDNIVTRDDSGKIVPQIATEWRYLSDTQFELTLRSDVTFHDGSRLMPEDVVFSVERIIDPNFKSPQFGQFNKITKAEQTGAHTVVLTTDGSYPVLLAQLVKLSVVPKNVVEKVGNEAFNKAPVGSGPYVFETWNAGVSVSLTRNDAYWGEKGAFARAVYRAVPDAATRVADLQAGTADLVVSLDSDLARQLEASGSAKTLSSPTERVGFLGINVARAPLDDPEIRKAVAMAIDRDGIVQGILGAGERVVGQMATDAHFGYAEDVTPIPYDPDRAREIIAAAGDVAKTPIVFATSPVYDQRIVQAVQQMLAEAGLTVEINMTDMATYLKSAQNADRDLRPMMSFGRWSCACQDVDGVVFPLLHSSSNWSRVADPELDALLEEARNALDPEVRQAAYDKIHQIVKDKVYLLPLYQAAALYGAANGLEWQPTANESLFLNRMSWKD